MADALYAWTPAQFAAHAVLIEHQRDDNGACSCGVVPDGTWAGHVVDEMSKADVFAAALRGDT
jgi:hypothetical protein